jgi:Uma2 family endonuclease
MIQPIPPLEPVFYPESDGQPMSDNTRQFAWIYLLYGNIEALFHDRPDVFVCGNQNWYPVEGEPNIVAAPDVYVVFGRPKGHRGSYKQWEEGGVPMTVVFEVLSPRNTPQEMADKLLFYDEHGVEEYYKYDPDNNHLAVYLRQGTVLRAVHPVQDFVSPRLGIRFHLEEPEMVVSRPDGRRFLAFEELAAEHRAAEQARLAAEQAQLAAEQARLAAEQAQQVAEQQRQAAEQQRQAAEQARLAAEQERTLAQQRQQAAEQKQLAAEQRSARLVELGRKARLQQATPEELAELDRLENEAMPPG